MSCCCKEFFKLAFKCQPQHPCAEVGLLLCKLQLPAKHFAAKLLLHDLQLPAQHLCCHRKGLIVSSSQMTPTVRVTHSVHSRL